MSGGRSRRYHCRMSTFHDFTMVSITGEPFAFSQLAGKLCLVVNVASA